MSKTILITGAGRGIGFALAKAAAQAGHRIFALSRSIESLENLPSIEPLTIDITNANAIKGLTLQLEQEHVQLDALINNAGALINKPFSETTWADFEAVYHVNVFGLAELTRHLLPFIKSSGHVVNISSMGGLEKTGKFPGLAAYSSSKAAVNILTELLAEEYKATGPAFNALALGAVQTEMLSEAFPGFKAPHTPASMADHIMQFALEGQQWYNGKILPLANTTP